MGVYKDYQKILSEDYETDSERHRTELDRKNKHALAKGQSHYDNMEPPEGGPDMWYSEDDIKKYGAAINELLECIYSVNEETGWELIPSRKGKEYDKGSSWTEEELKTLNRIVTGEWLEQAKERTDS